MVATAIETTAAAAAFEDEDAGLEDVAAAEDRESNKEAEWSWASPCQPQKPEAFAVAADALVAALVAAELVAAVDSRRRS